MANNIAKAIGVLLALALIVWIVPAMTIVAWDLLADMLLVNIVNAGYLPADITWAQAFTICAFFFIASGYIPFRK